MLSSPFALDYPPYQTPRYAGQLSRRLRRCCFPVGDYACRRKTAICVLPFKSFADNVLCPPEHNLEGRGFRVSEKVSEIRSSGTCTFLAGIPTLKLLTSFKLNANTVVGCLNCSGTAITVPPFLASCMKGYPHLSGKFKERDNIPDPLQGGLGDEWYLHLPEKRPLPSMNELLTTWSRKNLEVSDFIDSQN